ncbi:MAG: Gfo/Idh/MocA family oxidoreductase [Tenericutes bacterium]|jgi:predicted dehydrogenase|nr:Gfo/Idh/MocA family oxidoreductase [Mycoplasmatota bacterium]
MKKFKTGIVGAGFIGIAHIENLRRLGNVEVIALSDRFDAEKKAKNLYIEHAYENYQTMIKELDLDFIHICTPNNTHFEIAKFALENNINVILEKPMTFTVEEAEKLTKLAKDKKLINAVNFHNRLYPTNIHIKNILHSKEIGDVISISGAYLQDWLLFDTDYSWRLNSKESGLTRAVADIGSHWMDLVEYLTGLRITEVLAEFKTQYPKRKKPIGNVESFSKSIDQEYKEVEIDTEDIALLLFKFDNGAIGSSTISQMSAGNKNNLNIEISGTKASIKWSLKDLENIYLGYRDEANKVIPKDLSITGDAASAIDYPAGHTEGFPDAIKQVFKEVYNQPEIKHYATFSDGLRQMILCDKIYQSAKNRQWVKIEE